MKKDPRNPKKPGPERLRSITDPVAAARWRYSENGEWVEVKVVIGRPQAGDDTWYCPLYIEGFCPTTAIFGVGPVDSLLNATKLVERFMHERGAHPLAP